MPHERAAQHGIHGEYVYENILDNSAGASDEDAMITYPPTHTKFRHLDYVQKKSGGCWRGRVVGWYTTDLTPEGYAVESMYEPGSVQIYPATALVRMSE